MAATKTFIATATALARLAAQWSGNAELAGAIARLPARLADAASLDWSAALPALSDAKSLVTIGRGSTLAIAREAALKLKETCNLHAEAFSGAEFLNGPVSLVSDRYPILMFMPTDAAGPGMHQLAVELRGKGTALFVAEPGVVTGTRLPALPPEQPEADAICLIQSFYAMVVQLAARLDIDIERLGRDEPRIDRRGHRQWVVDERAVEPVVALVELVVPAQRVRDEADDGVRGHGATRRERVVGCRRKRVVRRAARPARHRHNVLRADPGALGDVEAEGDWPLDGRVGVERRGPRGEADPCRLGVAMDVPLRRRRRVALRPERPTHKDVPAKQPRERRFAFERDGQVRERSECDQRDLARSRSRCLDDDVDPVSIADLAAGWRELRIADPRRSVGLRRGLERPIERREKLGDRVLERPLQRLAVGELLRGAPAPAVDFVAHRERAAAILEPQHRLAVLRVLAARGVRGLLRGGARRMVLRPAVRAGAGRIGDRAEVVGGEQDGRRGERQNDDEL